MTKSKTSNRDKQTDIVDARTLIYEELSSLHINQKIQGDSYNIQCPFHDDRTPSCGVNIALGTNIPLGFFHCFGCGTKGGWNKLANKLNLRTIKNWEMFEGEGAKKKVNRRDLLGTTNNSIDRLLEEIGTKQAIEWPRYMEWRGYKGSLIKKLGGIYFNDHLTDELMLVFPVYINGRYKGGVRAYLEKQVGQTSYLTTKGSWAKSYGLFGYEFIKPIIRKAKYRSIVITEGPRDFLRMVDNQIPALSILGSRNFDETKLMYIMSISSSLDTIYVLPDNDKAGKEMYKLIKEVARGRIKVKHLKLPKEKDKKGNVIKMDPDNAPKDIIISIKELIEERQSL